MKKLIFSICSLCFLTLAQAQPPAGDANPGDQYGAAIAATYDPMNIDDVVAKLKTGSEYPSVKIKAKVVDVCPKKGCWLKLALADGSEATVKMKDYGFFLPLAIKGKTIILEGEVKMKTTSVAELKHYAEDAKKTKEEIDAITTPKKEVRILASGIAVAE
ncbi:MAG: DUF4920 domain-containing protein [Chitinophagaceae bacterium]|nr:DUF4920 domain-containing protein [Chitinophagaceae bacterium]HQV06968.1 DUF4920 domain-containing protein [Chitinophagaceae bacterium]